MDQEPKGVGFREVKVLWTHAQRPDVKSPDLSLAYVIQPRMHNIVWIRESSWRTFSDLNRFERRGVVAPRADGGGLMVDAISHEAASNSVQGELSGRGWDRNCYASGPKLKKL